jgi:pantoate--beta-alanine ligase
MSRSLHPSIEVLSVETIRDTDGLALSSRNARLSPSARINAKIIPEALLRLRSVCQSGQVDSATLKQTALEILSSQPDLTIAYLEIVDREKLEPQAKVKQGTCVVLFAGVIEGIRLIDNIDL